MRSALLLTCLTAACAMPENSGPANPAVELPGINWRLVSMSGNAALDSASARPAFIMFSADEMAITGSGGCNSMSGTYHLAVDDNRLDIDPGAMTLMACAEPAMNQEDAFVTMLGNVDAYRIDAGALLLLKGDSVLARFIGDSIR